MASLAGPAGLLQGLVEGERRRRERRLQDEERRRQEEQRERERKLERLRLLLQATENPAIVPRGVAGGAGGRRRGGQGPAGTTVVGSGPAESTAPSTPSPMTESAPLLGLADRARRGEAPGQESASPGGALTLASEAVETRDRSRERPSRGQGGGRGRVLGLGPLNELLGRSGQEEFVFDPSRTPEARKRRQAAAEERERQSRKVQLAKMITDLNPNLDFEDAMRLELGTLRDELQNELEEERERLRNERERRRERLEEAREEREQDRIAAARDIVIQQARSGATPEEAQKAVQEEGYDDVIRSDDLDFSDAYSSGRELYRSTDRGRLESHLIDRQGPPQTDLQENVLQHQLAGKSRREIISQLRTNVRRRAKEAGLSEEQIQQRVRDAVSEARAYMSGQRAG